MNSQGLTYHGPHSDWNDIDPSQCFNGHCCASALSFAGMNWSDPNSNFIARLDEMKVWNITQPADSYFETVDALVAPRIARAEKAVGSDLLTLILSEGVSGSGASAELTPGDFILAADPLAPLSIVTVTHNAGDARTTLLLNRA